MPPTTVESKTSLDAQQRVWLKKMGAALQVKLSGPAQQTDGAAADADLMAKCKQIKAAVAPRIKEAVAADPSKKDKIKELLEAATAQESKGSYAEALDTLKDLATTVKEALQNAVPGAPPPPVAKSPTPSSVADPVAERSPAKSAEQEAYEKELKEVKALVDELRKHAHKKHIAGELTLIQTELGKAATAAKGKMYADAMKALEKAKEIAGKAKGYADKFAEYSKKRADANYMIKSFKKLLETADFNAQSAAIVAADNLAKPPTRDYAGATTKIEAVITALDTSLKTLITDTFITPNAAKLQTLKTGTQKDFLADYIKASEDQMTVLNGNVAAKEYNKCIPAGWKLDELVQAATEAATRRTAFDTQRVKTVTAIDGLKPFTALSAQMGELNKRLKEADDQASLETRQFENATEAIAQLEKDAQALAKHGPDAESYANDRKAADKAYEDLAKQKQAAAQKPLLDGIKTKLERAAELVKDPTKASAANAELKLARQQIDAATKALGEADAVCVVANNASDAATGKKSLDALKISLAAAKKHKRAADFAIEFKALDDKVAAAEKKLKDSKTVAEAIAEIKSIGNDLAKVMIQLSQQEGYGAERAALEDRLTKLKALPEAKAIEAHIAPLETALKDADTQDKAHAFDKRSEAMVKARDAADLGEKSAEQCKTVNTQQQQLETKVKSSALATAEKQKVTDAIKPAAQQAASLNFDEATKLLVKAEATYESLLIKGFAKKSPPDLTQIKDAADRIMKSGNAKEIDKLIQELPNSTKHAVLVTLAKERFGIELKTDRGSETRSAKAMLNMLAKVPEDARNNPSLKTVERRTPGDDGGWYETDTKSIVMNGRPGQATQGFGPGIASELPGDVEPDCQPKDARTVDFFDFATLHELGHSVDDNLQYMATREGKAEFGSWKTYGGNTDPIVDAVADWTGYNSTPEQKKAISDLIQGNQVTWPTPPAGKEVEWKDAKDKVTKWFARATGNGIWESQSMTSKININGTVYHRAYKRTWVSYDFDARKKGITGYQFRAPGEWFAELYAAYRLEKLKSSHPAVSWLSTLKV